MRRMVLGCCTLSCAALAACASSNVGASTSPPAETVRVSAGGTGNITMTTTPTLATNGGTVGFPVDRVWSVLRSVFDSLGIPVATVDQANHIIGNPGIRVRRHLGDVALSKYLNCGSTQGTPSADTYDVQLSILTQARTAAPGATAIATTIDAHAKPITISGEFVQCTTTSTLETKIVEMANARLVR